MLEPGPKHTRVPGLCGTWKLLWVDVSAVFLSHKIGIVVGLACVSSLTLRLCVCVGVCVCVWVNFPLIFRMHAWKLFSFCLAANSKSNSNSKAKPKGCWQRQETLQDYGCASSLSSQKLSASWWAWHVWQVWGSKKAA